MNTTTTAAATERDWREEDPQITAQVEALFAVCADYERGQVVPYSKIERAIGMRRDTERGKYVLQKARRRIRKERDIVIRPEVSVGWRMLTDTEAAKIVPHDRQRRAVRQIRRGLVECQSVRAERLTPRERQLLAANMQAMEAERREISAALRADTKGRKTETMPRNRVPVGAGNQE